MVRMTNRKFYPNNVIIEIDYNETFEFKKDLELTEEEWKEEIETTVNEKIDWEIDGFITLLNNYGFIKKLDKPNKI
jgi:hypothetical protein